MIDYVNKHKFDEYVNGLEKAIHEGKWEEYMNFNDDRGIYFKSAYTPEDNGKAC